MKIWTKEQLITELKAIKRRGWIPNARPGNDGGVGNTLEDLLGIEENNLPIPNAAEWELKSQRAKTSALTTLFHMEPSPRAFKFVPKIFLPNYGWGHKESGKKYPLGEMSFRQTISGVGRSDRGFTVKIDNAERKVIVSFDAKYVSAKHKDWLKEVKRKIGLDEIYPQPYWGFDDLFHKAGTKLINCFYVQADVKKENSMEFYSYSKIMMLQNFSICKFLEALLNDYILVDFDARSGHNHGTKFRLRKNKLHNLYESVTEI